MIKPNYRKMIQKLFVIIVFVSGTCLSQEICNNGIDDDGNGLIDLNDPECICNQLQITSLIPNPSFEDFTQCPTGPSQLNFCTSWIQATNATTDYFNCGYSSGVEMPYPDQNAVVGAIFRPEWKEYLGTCLPVPLEANTNYKLVFI
jgi:large repetitive protein